MYSVIYYITLFYMFNDILCNTKLYIKYIAFTVLYTS